MADNYTTVDQLPNNAEIADSDIIYEKSQTDNLGNGTDYKVTASALKAYVRPELAGENNSGLMGTAAQSFSGKKTFSGGVESTDGTFSGDVQIDGDVHIGGDVVIHGSQKKVEVQTLEVESNFIKLRDGAQTGLGNNELSGLSAEKYDGTNNGILAFGADGIARVGDEGDEQTLATRADNPANGTLGVFNSTTKRFEPIAQGASGSLLESQGANAAPAFVTLPKVSIDHITQIVESVADGGINEIECELTNGDKSMFYVRNGSGRGISFTGTRAQYNAAKMITEGNVGFIPDGSLVVITDEDEIITGEEK